jgi:hypothetical protein
MAVKVSRVPDERGEAGAKIRDPGMDPVADPALREFFAGSRVSLRKAFSFASLARDTRARR